MFLSKTFKLSETAQSKITYSTIQPPLLSLQFCNSEILLITFRWQIPSRGKSYVKATHLDRCLLSNSSSLTSFVFKIVILHHRGVMVQTRLEQCRACVGLLHPKYTLPFHHLWKALQRTGLQRRAAQIHSKLTRRDSEICTRNLKKSKTRTIASILHCRPAPLKAGYIKQQSYIFI